MIVPLTDGFKIGEHLHTEAELKECSAGDLIDATVDAERLVATREGDYVLVASPTLVGMHALRRQIVRIGEHQGPLTLAELKRLSGRDLNLLRNSAQALETASLKGVEERGKK